MKRHPLLLALLGLASGILLAGFFSISVLAAASIFGLCLVLLISFIILPRTRISPNYFLLFTFLGMALNTWQDDRFAKNHYSNLPEGTRLYSAKLLNTPSHTKKALRLELALQFYRQAEIAPVSGKLFLYTLPDSALAMLLPGDIILFEGKLNALSPPQNPYEFDYKNYLNLHQIYAQCYSTHVKALPQNSFDVWRFAAKIRLTLFAYIKEMHLRPEEESVASALLLGYRHLLSDETQQAFSGAGAMHVLAVSGLHVGILYVITSLLLRIDKKKPQRNAWPKVAVAIGIVWLYATLTGLSPSVTRAAVMFTFIAAGHLAKRKPAIIQMIIGSAIFLLAYKPNYLFDVGFQLSYSAVFGIVYLQSRFYDALPKSRFWIVDQIWKITTVSIAAQAATFPLSVYYFHQFPLFFIVSNLIVIPLAWLLMYFGIFMLLISSLISPPFWLIAVFQFLLRLMTESVHIVENLPHSVLNGLHVTRFDLVIITLLVYFLADALWKKKKWVLFASLTLATFLSLKFSVEAFEKNTSQQITLYSIPQTSALEIRAGHDAVLLADTGLLNDEDAMLFFIRHNLWAGSISKTEEFSWNENSFSKLHNYQNNVLDVFKKRFLFYNQPSDSLKLSLHPDYLIVTKSLTPPKHLPIDCVVLLQNGINPKSKLAWKEKGATLHVLETDGAFILKN